MKRILLLVMIAAWGMNICAIDYPIYQSSNPVSRAKTKGTGLQFTPFQSSLDVYEPSLNEDGIADAPYTRKPQRMSGIMPLNDDEEEDDYGGYAGTPGSTDFKDILPIGDGLWCLLFLIVGYSLVISFRRYARYRSASR